MSYPRRDVPEHEDAGWRPGREAVGLSRERSDPRSGPREPDPTLADIIPGSTAVMLTDCGETYEAHRIVEAEDPWGGADVEVSQCQRWATSLSMPANRAAYVAVPCRECFPDAPERGQRQVCVVATQHDPEPGLAWQVDR